MEVYIQNTLLLTRSLVIKSALSAQRVNDKLIRDYGEAAVDLGRPRTWKYYMNICGQYHPTDQMMRVISLDTQKEIDFTVANMAIHTATAREYRYGSRYYFSLVNKYPDQVQLIMAVNNPANMDHVIAAKDGEILAYYKDLVESQEHSLMYRLNEYISNWLVRYTVQGFNNTRVNYPTLNLNALYGSLPTQILNIRFDLIKTEQTHSFHITQYLASHGRLDKFIPYMTLKQKLYLYHNIDVLEKYAGFTSTFEELIQWLLSDRFIPISSYTVRQLQEFDGELYPVLRARRKPLGTEVNITSQEYLPIEELYDKEKPVQLGTPQYYLDKEKAITRRLATDDTSVIQTKDLESSMTDYTNSVPDSLPDVLLRQWAYMSGSGLYNVLTNFNHPVTGARVSIMAADALIYYSYVFMTATGVKLDVVPDFVDVKYRLHPRPPVELLLKEVVDDWWPDLPRIAHELVSAQPMIEEVFSVTAFYDLSYKIYEECQGHWFRTAEIGDQMKRGIVAKMISRLFGINCMQLTPSGTKMADWLHSKSLPEFTGDYDEGMRLCKAIFEAATGYVVDDTKSTKAIQRAMIAMFKQLSSYSIQILKEINDSELILLNWPAIRVTIEGPGNGVEGTENVAIPSGLRVNDTDATGGNNVEVPIACQVITAQSAPVTLEVDIPSDVQVKIDTSEEPIVQEYRIDGSNVRISDPEATSVDDAFSPFLPMTYYNALSQSEILEIANRLSNEVYK